MNYMSGVVAAIGEQALVETGLVYGDLVHRSTAALDDQLALHREEQGSGCEKRQRQ